MVRGLRSLFVVLLFAAASWPMDGHGATVAAADDAPAEASPPLFEQQILFPPEPHSWYRIPSLVVHEGPASYSDLAVSKEKTIVLIYEGGQKTWNEYIAVARFNRSWVAQ